MKKAGVIVGVLTMAIPYQFALTQPEEWKAPPEAGKLANPFKGGAEEGKKLFIQMCVTCHGNLGKGDGDAGESLTPRPTDLTSQKVQAQSDGVIFWKINKGRSPMAPYEYVFKEEQRWQLVNYIRKLGKTTGAQKTKQ